MPVCGIVMGSGSNTYVLSGALVSSVPLYTPVTVRGRKTGMTISAVARSLR